MKEQKTVQETQGVKKVQKASVSYALEAVKKHIETIEENYLHFGNSCKLHVCKNIKVNWYCCWCWSCYK